MLQINNIQKSYDKKQVIDTSNLFIPANQSFGLVGNNGAGKTTLFRLILDLIKADSGEVLHNEKNVATHESWKKTTASYLDDSFLVPFLTPEEHFEFIAQAYNVQKKDLQQRLTAFDDFFADEILGQNKYIRTFSQGNKRKIGIASAMLVQPQLLILDEPFANLDPSSQFRLINLLNNLKAQRKTTIVISSHDLAHITSICERIALIEKGKIIQDILVDNDTLKTLENYFSIEKIK